jgi:hypothetical protein
MSLVGIRMLSTVVGILLIAGIAKAATEDNAGVSVTKAEKSLATRILEKTSFSYFGFLAGPAVSNVTNYQLDPMSGKASDPVAISSQFRANIGINNKGAYIGPFITARIQPTIGQTMTLTDSGFRVGNTSLVKVGDFNWSADARFLAPFNQSSKDRDLAMTLQSTHGMNYTPTGSRFAVGFFTSVVKHFLGANGAKHDFDLYLGPNFTYKASDTLSMTTYFEIYQGHTYGDRSTDFKASPFDINPMVNFQVNKILTLSPGIVYTPSVGTFESLSYMAYIFAAL